MLARTYVCCVLRGYGSMRAVLKAVARTLHDMSATVCLGCLRTPTWADS